MAARQPIAGGGGWRRWRASDAIHQYGLDKQRVRVLPARIALYFTLALWFCPGQGYAEVLRCCSDSFGLMRRTGRWRIPTVSARSRPATAWGGNHSKRCSGACAVHTPTLPNRACPCSVSSWPC
ncbi:transposase domain-containing protein [Micromonospora sp. ATA32]|nr:transposase domain-containing protein [Micromonospora sp. ATA32]